VLPFMALGGNGVITVVSILVPEHMKQVTSAMHSNDFVTARTAQFTLRELNQAMFVQSNPIPVKAACAMMGWMDWELRLPLTILPQNMREDLFAVMKAFGLKPERANP